MIDFIRSKLGHNCNETISNLEADCCRLRDMLTNYEDSANKRDKYIVELEENKEALVIEISRLIKERDQWMERARNVRLKLDSVETTVDKLSMSVSDGKKLTTSQRKR